MVSTFPSVYLTVRVLIQKIMMKEGLKVALNVIMKNHVYNFNNEMRKQEEGGAIGMDLTGSVANIFMTWRDKELLKRLNELYVLYNPTRYDSLTILPNPNGILFIE